MDCLIFKKEDLMSKSFYELMCDLKDTGAPLNFNRFNVDLTHDDICVLGRIEAHPDIKGGITYTWGW